MCAIFGIISKSELDIEHINKALGVMAQRGPDDEGIVTIKAHDDVILLGHKRLSIIDLSNAAHQPMSTYDKAMWIVHSGEVYNYIEIREELRKLGYVFASNSDTEVVLYSFMQWGSECLKRFNGQFAFAIWDSKNNQLFIARDRIGFKPLYYCSNKDYFCFSSTIKSFFEAGFVQPQLNYDGLYQYLTFGCVPSPDSLFRSIYKLPPGYYMTVKAPGEIRSECYWDILDHHDGINYKFDEYDAILLRQLDDSVGLRLRSDVPIGVLLSGGLDSSITSYLASRKMRDIQAFTIGFENYDHYNELSKARSIAQHLHIKHHTVVLKKDDLMVHLPYLIALQEEPIANPIFFVIYFLTKAIKESGTKVVLTGDGGDELFFGYGHWRRILQTYHLIWRYLITVPQKYRKLLQPVTQLLPIKFYAELLNRWINNRELYQATIAFYEYELMRILTRSFHERAENTKHFFIERLRHKFCHLSQRKQNYANWMLYIALKTYFVEDYLMRLDKMGIANAVECRAPILDHRIVESSFDIELRYRTWKYGEKYFLKKMARKILPSYIINQKKQGFCAPIIEWLDTDKKLINYASSALKELKEVFNEKFLSSIDEFFIKHSALTNSSYWGLVNLGLWLRFWIFGEKI